MAAAKRSSSDNKDASSSAGAPNKRQKIHAINPSPVSASSPRNLPFGINPASPEVYQTLTSLLHDVPLYAWVNIQATNLFRLVSVVS